MRVLLMLLWTMSFSALEAQKEYQTPVIKNFGGIYAIDEATVIPVVDRRYDIVIDLYAGDDPTQINSSLNNVARMINMHVIGGLHPDSINVVLAIHAKATKIP